MEVRFPRRKLRESRRIRIRRADTAAAGGGTADPKGKSDGAGRKDKPPARFTESTLLAAMVNPVRYMNPGIRRWRRCLVRTGGLGTVATRADIIEKLFNSFLMEKRGNEIYLTAKARQQHAI